MEAALTKLGVQIQCGALVKAVDKDGLAVEVDKRLDHISGGHSF
jgi:NADH dehydrogenase FAD-containing subunit